MGSWTPARLRNRILLGRQLPEQPFMSQCQLPELGNRDLHRLQPGYLQLGEQHREHPDHAERDPAGLPVR